MEESRRGGPRLGRSAAFLVSVVTFGALILWGSVHKASSPPDILLISVDTLRPDHLQSYGYQRENSPVIRSVGEAGMVVADVVSPLPATDPAHASLLTGIHPLRHGVLTNAVVLRPGIETLAEVLSKRGYHTMGATGVYHLGQAFGFGRGFAEFSGVGDSGRVEERTADEVNKSVYAMLERFRSHSPRKPLFLFVHYFDPHSPYLLRRGGRVVEASGSVDQLIAGYDSEIRFVDGQIGDLLRRLRLLGLDRKLLVCITSDHGEQFGEHGYTGGHADMYRETTRVPLILAGPGVPRRRLQERVSLMDVPVTLAAAAGASFTHGVDGLSFLDTAATASAPTRRFLLLGYPSYTRSIQVLEGDWAFIRNLDHVYRSAAVERPWRVEKATLLGDGFQELKRAADDARTNQGQWELPALGFEPQSVTVVIKGTAACRGKVSLILHPRIRYFAEPIDLQGGLRLRFGGSRQDRIAVLISPARCAESVLSRSARYREPVTRAGRATAPDTDLYVKLLTLRKSRADDELYDMRSDPGMLDNLGGRPERRPQVQALARVLESTYRRASSQAGRTPGDWEILDPHAAEMLRSLGYLQ